MSCPRCSAKLDAIGEYFNYFEESLVRDFLCTMCNSVIVEHFFSSGSYKSEWIDLNV